VKAEIYLLGAKDKPQEHKIARGKKERERKDREKFNKRPYTHAVLEGE